MIKFDMSPNYPNQRMLQNMHGPLFVALGKTLQIKPCLTRCRPGLRKKWHFNTEKVSFTSIRDAISKIGAKLKETERFCLVRRFQLCRFFQRQGYITNWSFLVKNVFSTEQFMRQWHQVFAKWREKTRLSKRRPLTQAVLWALRSDPPLTCEQATFCLDTLPAPLCLDLATIWYRLLLRACHKVEILDDGCDAKDLIITFVADDTPITFPCPALQ